MTIDVTAFTFDEEDARVVALAVTTYAALLAAAEPDEKRREKKIRHVHNKVEILNRVGFEFIKDPSATQLGSLLAQSARAWVEEKRNALLIDLAFADPFAPYQLETSAKHRRQQLRELCAYIGLPAERAEQVLDSISEARKVHRNIAWGKIAAGAVLGAIVIAAGGYLAAPLLAAQLGAAAGLTGAAAVAHGLALLGGGSLAAGGAGMAGGMTLIVGCSGALGGVGVGGAAALWNAGYAAALGEIVKLQVSFKEILLRMQLRGWHAAEVIDELVRQKAELNRKLDEERALNDEGAARVGELERIIKGYEDAIAWMRRQGRAS